MVKEREYNEYEEEESDIGDDEEFVESELEIEGNDANSVLAEEDGLRFRRTWRDTEKYKEMRELYKIINDELYTGFDAGEFLEDEDWSK